jgi:DNA-binding LytR/AlgR family response regulator
MNIVICGGGALDARRIEEQIKRIEPEKHKIAFKSCEELISLLDEGAHFDLIFCDIDVKTSSSLTCVKQISKHIPSALVVLISTNSTLMIEWSEYVWRYEIKPVSATKIKYILARAKQVLAPQLVVLPAKTSHEYLTLNIHSIVYFEILDKTGLVHTTDNKTYAFRAALTKIESDLPAGTFFKPHKSFLVNIEYIQYITEREIYMSGNILIPLSRNKKTDLFKLLSSYSDIIYS